MKRCDSCKGTKRLMGMGGFYHPCKVCHATGYIKPDCATNDNVLIKDETKTVNLAIEPLSQAASITASPNQSCSSEPENPLKMDSEPDLGSRLIASLESSIDGGLIELKGSEPTLNKMEVLAGTVSIVDPEPVKLTAADLLQAAPKRKQHKAYKG